jgi:hypothetical protein
MPHAHRAVLAVITRERLGMQNELAPRRVALTDLQLRRG